MVFFNWFYFIFFFIRINIIGWFVMYNFGVVFVINNLWFFIIRFYIIKKFFILKFFWWKFCCIFFIFDIGFWFYRFFWVLFIFWVVVVGFIFLFGIFGDFIWIFVIYRRSIRLVIFFWWGFWVVIFCIWWWEIFFRWFKGIYCK